MTKCLVESSRGDLGAVFKAGWLNCFGRRTEQAISFELRFE